MLHPAVIVRSKGTIEGDGLFTTKPIPKGAIVWALAEPIFNWDEVETWRGERRSAFNKYGFQCGVDRFSLPLGPSREMNHSCDPCVWWTGSDTMIARRDILAGEEIAYDYSTCDIDLVFEMECHCGSSHCRRNISNRDYQDQRWQKQYGLNLPAHVLAAIETIKSLAVV